jgi:tRNA1(Val) A37 N6-methylase TrmN6
VLPLAARPGRDAKRVIVRARKGGRAPFRLAAPLILHRGATHIADGDDYTAQARAILRDAAELVF